MKKIVVTFGILSFLFCSVAWAGDVYFYGTMVGSGRQHIIYEDRSFATSIEKFTHSPLGWALAGYAGAVAVERVVMIPKVWQMKTQEIELMKIQVEKSRELAKIEIEKAKKELEFLYSPSKNWRDTPRGIAFQAKVSAQLHRPSTPVYYFDTGN